MRLLIIVMLFSSISRADYSIKHPQATVAAKQVELAFKDGKAMQRTNLALGLLLRRSVRKLRKSGHHQLAREIAVQWNSRWRWHLLSAGYDLGDHEPMSQWLAGVYDKLENALGPMVMKWFHLDDLKTINYALPVVFMPCRPEWDRREYQKHFAPLAGVLSYWTAWGLCTGATAGLGLLFCDPVGLGSEWLMLNHIAPSLSDTIYRSTCGPGTIIQLPWKPE